MIHASTSRAIRARARAQGFTLIEVMITVAIVGILAAIAMPSYKSYVRRGQQPEAFNALADYRTKMEQYYQDNRNYGDTTGTVCATSTTANSWNGFVPPGAKYFTYACVTSSTGQAYTITATGSAGQVNGDVYTIDQNGNRTTTVFKATTLSTPAQCWLTSGPTC